MSRPIKFRAWTKWGMVYPDNAEVTIDVHASSAWKDAADDEAIILMQYTGLQDKNGREIYEGDVIASTPPNISFHGRPMAVRWSERCCAFLIVTPKLTPKGHDTETLVVHVDMQYIEVIGNIYMNPEL